MTTPLQHAWILLYAAMDYSLICDRSQSIAMQCVMSDGRYALCPSCIAYQWLHNAACHIEAQMTEDESEFIMHDVQVSVNDYGIVTVTKPNA